MRTFAVLLALVGLSACGGGGGGGGGGDKPSMRFSTSDLTFTASGPWGEKPADQIISATLHGNPGGVVYITIISNNPELISVSNLMISERTGQVTVIPVEPNNLGTGSYEGTITVVACRNDPACKTGRISGTPKTIRIHYVVPSNVEGDVVMPGVVSAGEGGRIILRGRKFPSGATVSIGTVAGAVEFVSSSELHVTYPALAAGSFPVTVNSGSVPFNANLDVVPQTSYSAAFLPHPWSQYACPAGIAYDARRQSILVGAMPNGEANQLLRYAYTGSEWSSPTSIVLPDLQQLLLSVDGTKLLALRSSQFETITELDPATLSIIASTAAPGTQGGASFSLVNDGHALLSLAGMNATGPYMYSVASRRIFELPGWITPGATFASDDGSKAFFTNGRDTDHYDPSNGTIHVRFETNFASGGMPIPGTLDGSRIISGLNVVDGETLKVIGMLGLPTFSPEPGGAIALINRAGTRGYVFDLSNRLHSFDLTLAPVWSETFQLWYFQEAGPPTAAAGDFGVGFYPRPQATMTPDGRAIMIVGCLGVLVQPVPF